MFEDQSNHTLSVPTRRYRYNGAVYDPALDNTRLDKQIGRVYDCMIDGRWRTLEEISQLTGDPPASISAQLRHLRKERFGSYLVAKRPRGEREHGLFEYQLIKRVVPVQRSQMQFFGFLIDNKIGKE